mgnify:CR=1 FL=1
MDYLYRYMQCISTHALTEATWFQIYIKHRLAISTHALTEGDISYT